MNLEIPLFITGLGVVGSFGDSPELLKHAISENLPPQASDVEHRYGTAPAMLADTSGLKAHINPRLMRRMDKFSRLALYASTLAIKDANLPDGAEDKKTALIVATGFGAIQTTFDFLDSFIEAGDTFASPTKFTNSLHNAATSSISLLSKLKGPCSTITAFEHSFPSALLTAYSWLHEERVDRVLLGTVDEVCPVITYCFEKYFTKTTGPATPNDFSKHSAIPGEGSAFLVLEAENSSGQAIARIDQVETNAAPSSITLSTPSVYLGNDGNQITNPLYAETTARSSAILHSIGDRIGSFPTAQALDLVAAISNAFQDDHAEVSCLRHNIDHSSSLIKMSRM